MQTRKVELTVGLFLIAGILALLVLAFQVSGLSNIAGHNGYKIVASFDNVGDLKVRAPVSIGGVRVGEVTGIRLDKNTFRALVTMQINQEQNTIPQDSSASIYTQGLLGSNYISISPGFSDANLKNGDKIDNTHSALILENLIGQFMYKLNSSDPPNNTSKTSTTQNTPDASSSNQGSHA